MVPGVRRNLVAGLVGTLDCAGIGGNIAVVVTIDKEGDLGATGDLVEFVQQVLGELVRTVVKCDGNGAWCFAFKDLGVRGGALLQGLCRWTVAVGAVGGEGRVGGEGSEHGDSADKDGGEDQDDCGQAGDGCHGGEFCKEGFGVGRCVYRKEGKEEEREKRRERSEVESEKCAILYKSREQSRGRGWQKTVEGQRRTISDKVYRRKKTRRQAHTGRVIYI